LTALANASSLSSAIRLLTLKESPVYISNMSTAFTDC